MEVGATNHACLSSVTVDEKPKEEPITCKDEGSTTSTRTLPQRKNTSVVKSLMKWRKYLILLLTPILLMPLPIAVPSSVRS